MDTDRASLRPLRELRKSDRTGFHGGVGFVASWRPLYQSCGAIRIGGSKFKTFAEAEDACNTMLKHLTTEE
jgi:hypothetical protein